MLRGIAITLVVFYHFAWDIGYFGLYPVNALSPGWLAFARGIGTSFIFLLGLSLTLSYNGYLQRRGQAAPFSKYLGRGARIFALGLVITGVTYFAIGRGFVIFGILHLLGLTIILAYPFLRLNRWFSLALGLVLIGLGVYLNSLSVSFPWLIWLGVKQQGRAMFDYYPLLPWFGVVLLGIFAGRSLYPQGAPRLALPDLSTTPVIRELRLLGQHSLSIYLLHQPILIATLIGLGLRVLPG